ncbi:hypothetical protein HMI54_003210 [Coelomomyces lativittatus]|nr:hypothetical protein HMI54_003210 [Coelomomyces lativittatus]KAJ1513155.1 hypothetical protein HMI56_002941 [Coelomomyces lativittatus]
MADLGLALMNLPIWFSNAITGHWVTRKWGCDWNGVMCSYFVFNTVITLFFITAERYFSIVIKKKLEQTQIIKVLIMFWFLGGAYAALPFLSSSGYMVQSSLTYCAPNWSSLEPSAHTLKIIICAMISSTVFLMAFAYYRIISVFQKSQSTFHSPKLVNLVENTNKAIALDSSIKSNVLDSSIKSTEGVSPRLLKFSTLPHVSLNDSSLNRSLNLNATFNASNAPLLKSWSNKVRGIKSMKRSPSHLLARKNEKMLLIRAVSVVLTFIICWCMYLAVWVLTWIHKEPVPVIVDGMSAFLVSIIGVMNPILTFTLDKRYKEVLLKTLRIKTASENQNLESIFVKGKG